MKKALALLLSLVLALALFASCTDKSSSSSSADTSGETSSESTSGEDSSSGDEVKEPVANQLVIGSTTKVDADMMHGWSNGAQNQAIKTLINEGLATMAWTIEGEYVENPVVLKESIAAVDNADGSRTYTIKINEGLVYNDGSPITAKDYVFNTLLLSSPEFAEQDGADATDGDRYVGYKEFNSGEARNFAGVRLLGDYEFSVTVDAEELPYHYEFIDYIRTPLPLAVIAPGCDVLDDGEGAYMSEEFTVELLKETILDSETGYRYNPKVTSGAYQFESYDPSTAEAVLKLNPNFPGMYNGHKPTIEKLILRLTTTDTQMDEMATGVVDFLSGIGDGTSIEAGLDLVEAEDSKVDYLTFGRNGYGAVFFACDFGPTANEEVRRAIGWLLDRDEFALTFTGGYGVTVDTYAGFGQKEYQQNKAELDKALTHYTLDLEKAAAELDAGGYNLDKDGNPYDASKGDAESGNIRHKKLADGTLEPLIIEWCSSEDNEVSDLLASKVPGEANKVGMKINQNVVDWTTLLANRYRTTIPEADWKYHMFNLATGFNTTQPYWYYLGDDPEYMGLYNADRISDPVLVETSKAMKTIPYDDEAAWNEAWIKLVTRYNEIAVSLPLYSNMYHTFYTKNLVNFEETSTYDWRWGIVYASIEGAQ